MKDTDRILVTGASGYIGGRLLARLVTCPYPVRAMARRTEGLEARWGDAVESVAADVLKPETLASTLEGVHTAYYLIHSMGAGGDFEARERSSAEAFGSAAKQACVQRIIYLGGLADEHTPLSPHMRSRLDTGRILRASGIPVLEFRASIVLGAGSLSFEMIRALVQRLPIMVTPRWIRVKAQPIHVEDLLDYLEQGLNERASWSGVVEIGGAEITTYQGIMDAYAEVRGLKRLHLPVPFLSPRISSLWLGLVTPLFARVGRKLIQSILHPSVVRNPEAATQFEVTPIGVKEAIERALQEEDQACATTRWSDSLSSGNTHRTWAGVRFGTRLVDSRTLNVPVSPGVLFSVVERIGGQQGWYFGTWLWYLRGAVDELLGGVGMRRGRKDPEVLHPGDVLDCWRVDKVDRPRQLRLRAEMKLPGRAWLEFEVTPDDGGGCMLRQTAVFDPMGLGGNLYWFGIYPVHALIFRGMIRGIAKQAESDAQEAAE